MGRLLSAVCIRRIPQGALNHARNEFDLLATNFRCPKSRVLIDEQQKPLSVLFIIEGQVNVSMNSFGGRRFLLGIACAGYIIGLTSAISARSSEIKAEARCACKIATMRRQDFLDFLANGRSPAQATPSPHSIAYRSVRLSLRPEQECTPKERKTCPSRRSLINHPPAGPR